MSTEKSPRPIPGADAGAKKMRPVDCTPSLAALQAAGVDPENSDVFCVLAARAVRLADGHGDPPHVLAMTLERLTGRPADLDWLAATLGCECSGAGAQSYARLLSVALRRRRQVARLWRALRDRLADPFGDGAARPATPIIVSRIVRRGRGGRAA